MSDSPFADRFAAKIQSGKDQPVIPEQKPTGLSSYDLSPPPPKYNSDQQRPGNMGAAMPPTDTPAPAARRLEPVAQQSGKPLGNVFSTPELTAPAIRRPAANNDSDVKRPPENNSEITPMAALDYVGTTLAGAGATKVGHGRVAKYVNEAQGRLSEHAVNPQLSAEFTTNQMRLKNTITERLADAEGSYAKLITENPGLLDRGPRFLYNSEGIAEATLEQLHRPLRINSMLENIDKIPVEKISAQQAEASQQLLGQFAQDPLAAREGLTDKALTASEKAGALLEAHTNLTANVGNEAAVAKAEQEFAGSIRALRLSAGTNLVTASEIASTIGEKHPEFVEEVERFKVDPRINPAQAAGIERYRNLNELNSTVRNVIVPVHESANTITHQGEHLGALRGLAEHPGIKAEGLVSEAQLLESSASKVSQARLTFNTAIEREMKAFPWTGAKVLVGALAADAAVDKMLFNDSPRGNKTIMADLGSASILATRINPWAKLGVMVGAHVVGSYFDYENAPKKKH